MAQHTTPERNQTRPKSSLAVPPRRAHIRATAHFARESRPLKLHHHFLLDGEIISHQANAADKRRARGAKAVLNVGQTRAPAQVDKSCQHASRSVAAICSCRRAVRRCRVQRLPTTRSAQPSGASSAGMSRASCEPSASKKTMKGASTRRAAWRNARPLPRSSKISTRARCCASSVVPSVVSRRQQREPRRKKPRTFDHPTHRRGFVERRDNGPHIDFCGEGATLTASALEAFTALQLPGPNLGLR